MLSIEYNVYQGPKAFPWTFLAPAHSPSGKWLTLETTFKEVRTFVVASGTFFLPDSLFMTASVSVEALDSRRMLVGGILIERVSACD